MEFKFVAQSGFIIQSKDHGIITIDLWLQNPLNPLTIDNVPKTNFVCCTHDHQDHDLATAIALAKRDESVLISNYDIMRHAQTQGVTNIAPGNLGGWYTVNGLEVQQVHAEHTSNIGLPIGIMLKIDGKIVYHMGDTGYFAGLKTLGEMYQIDVVMIPIGSRYTMGPYEASFALRDLKVKYAIPIHYNTSDKIQQDPQTLTKHLQDRGSNTQVKILQPGQTWEFTD